MRAKEVVRVLLDGLPDDGSLRDVLYHLFVVQQVERGLIEADAGCVVSHEAVVREVERKWILSVE